MPAAHAIARKKSSGPPKHESDATTGKQRAEASSPVLNPGACPCGGGCPRCLSRRSSQKRLPVSQPGDALEQEADAMADRMMKMPEPFDGAQIPGHSDPKIARRALPSAPSAATGAPPAVQSALRSSGQPLNPATRSFFEPRLGYDLNRVRIHTGPESVRAAQAVNAQAFTLGSDIVFDQGQYRPESGSGRQLLAHELVHVMQQNPADGHRAPAMIQRTAYSDCTDEQLPFLRTAVQNALNDLGTAITLLGQRPLTQQVSDALWLMFRDRSEHRASFARGFLEDIRAGLPDATIECDQAGGWDMVNAPGALGLGEGAGFTPGYGVIFGLGHIHLGMGMWDTLPEVQQEHTIIHEAAHLFVHASDRGYFDITDCRETAATADAAATTTVPGVRADNADCYACLVRLLARMSPQEVADRIGLYQGDTLRLRQSPPGTIDLNASEMSTTFSIGIPDPAMPELTRVESLSQFRWTLWDPQHNEYPLQDLFGGDSHEFGHSTQVIIPQATRALLRAHGITQGTVFCRYMMTGMGERLYWQPVQFTH